MYKNPTPTVDVIIEIASESPSDPQVVLIKRANPPLGWALPGGFVDEGERVEDAAIREALEETCLDVELAVLLGVYSDPSRDPRQHTMSSVYIATTDGTPSAADDAAEVGIFALSSLPSPLCFDHGLILADYRRFKLSGTLPPPRPSSSASDS